ncbi:hypothetical protein [Corynebacterium phoceense]
MPFSEPGQLAAQLPCPVAVAARPAIRLRRRMYLQRIVADLEDADEEGSYY